MSDNQEKLKITIEDGEITKTEVLQVSNFYEAYTFLEEHHIFEDPRSKTPEFGQALDLDVVKVNPETNSISDNDEENTKVQVWLECGPYVKEDDFEGYTHDINLDCGADTFEEAIIELANLVKKHYGENPEGYGEISDEEMNEISKRFDDTYLKNKGVK